MKIARLFAFGSALTLFAFGFTACEQQTHETLERLEASHHGGGHHEEGHAKPEATQEGPVKNDAPGH